MTAATEGSSHSWHEYRIGFVGNLARGLVSTIVPLLVGYVIAFALYLVLGLLLEEHMIDQLTGALGLSFDTEEAIETGIDVIGRAGLLIILTLGALSFLAMVSASAVWKAATSRALLAHAKRSAPRTSVPSPQQVDLVTGPYYGGLRVSLIILVAATVGFGCIAVGMALFGGYPEAATPGLLLLLAGAVAFGAYLLVRRVLAPEQQRRQQQIARHWTTEDEQQAWDVSRARAQQVPSDTDDAVDRNPWIRGGSRLMRWFGLLPVAAVGLALALVVITHPFGSRIDAGPRVSYASPIEVVIDVAYWAAGVAIVVGFLGLLVGSIVRSIGYRRESAWLQHRASDPRAAPPPSELLEEYATPRAVPFAIVLSVVAGAVLPSAIGVVLLGAGSLSGIISENEAVELLRPARLPAVGLTALMLLFVVVAAAWNSANMRARRTTRNALMARWPILPEIERDSEGKVTSSAAMLGPALTVGSHAEATQGPGPVRDATRPRQADHTRLRQ